MPKASGGRSSQTFDKYMTPFASPTATLVERVWPLLVFTPLAVYALLKTPPLSGPYVGALFIVIFLLVHALWAYNTRAACISSGALVISNGIRQETIAPQQIGEVSTSYFPWPSIKIQIEKDSGGYRTYRLLPARRPIWKQAAQVEECIHTLNKLKNIRTSACT